MGLTPDLPQRRAPPHFPPLERRNRPILIFLTVCTKKRERRLDNWYVFETLCEAWRSTDSWLVGRFIVLPDHVHLFLLPGRNYLPVIRFVGRALETKSHLKLRANRPAFEWQQNFWDTQVKSPDFYHSKWLYVEDNPVRHKLVARAEDWPFCGELNEFFWTSD